LRTAFGRAVVDQLVAPRAVDDYLELVDPCWSLEEARARVVKVVAETHDVTSLYLEPNDNWRPHRAGQHVLMRVEIDGVRRTRCFSLSSACRDDALVRITIKAHPQGLVSVWARDRARVGDVLTLSAPRGEFVLPHPVPDKLLFVSGGSGMTPLVAMAQQLAQQHYRGDLLWIHSDRQQAPLERDLHELGAAIPGATVRLHRSLVSSQGAERYLQAAELQDWADDWQNRVAFVCGPLGLMELVENLYSSAGRAMQVHSEDYQPRRQRAPRLSMVGAPGRVSFARSGREAEAEAGVSLLEQAEAAGLRPAHGCRRGICHACKCTKLEGSVRNELTGQITDGPNEEIQLCLTTPVGDVVLDL